MGHTQHQQDHNAIFNDPSIPHNAITQKLLPPTLYGDYFCWAKSFAFFHISLAYNWATQDVCSFNSMVDSDSSLTRPKIIIGIQNGKAFIEKVIDSRIAPIYLGNIPQSQGHCARLRTSAKLAPTDTISFHTMNRQFEQFFVGLGTTIAEDAAITQYNYSTTDFTSPSLVDLIRGVDNLARRDEQREKLAYVHCKAGKGRSATLVVAYLIYLFSIADIVRADGSNYTDGLDQETIIEMLIAYAKKMRSVVSINPKQRVMLSRFYTELKAARSFEQLYKSYEQAIQLRNAEFKDPKSTRGYHRNIDPIALSI